MTTHTHETRHKTAQEQESYGIFISSDIRLADARTGGLDLWSNAPAPGKREVISLYAYILNI
jgi:hypothetical protein